MTLRRLLSTKPNITKTSSRERRRGSRGEEEETAVGVDFLAEADLTPLTLATIYHFPGTFSFSREDQIPANFISLVSGTFRHNRVG